MVRMMRKMTVVVTMMRTKMVVDEDEEEEDLKCMCIAQHPGLWERNTVKCRPRTEYTMCVHSAHCTLHCCTMHITHWTLHNAHCTGHNAMPQRAWSGVCGLWPYYGPKSWCVNRFLPDCDKWWHTYDNCCTVVTHRGQLSCCTIVVHMTNDCRSHDNREIVSATGSRILEPGSLSDLKVDQSGFMEADPDNGCLWQFNVLQCTLYWNRTTAHVFCICLLTYK